MVAQPAFFAARSGVGLSSPCGFNAKPRSRPLDQALQQVAVGATDVEDIAAAVDRVENRLPLPPPALGAAAKPLTA